MKKILFLSLLVPFFSFAEIWVDYEPAEQVTEILRNMRGYGLYCNIREIVDLVVLRRR